MQRFHWNTIKTFIFSPQVVLAVCAALLVYSFVFQKPGLIRHIQLAKENKELKAEIVRMNERVEILKDKVTKLESDMDVLKAEAVKHGYAEPDEVIIKVPVP